ncbi:hypothetical protein AAHA92_21964 [Salvia divinorum]|uniref:Uncharacterized protein n=1 Tax=Salvia divinorum TaxID=28513 RepID=A0ABD1GQM2_SALDI
MKEEKAREESLEFIKDRFFLTLGGKSRVREGTEMKEKGSTVVSTRGDTTAEKRAEGDEGGVQRRRRNSRAVEVSEAERAAGQ